MSSDQPHPSEQPNWRVDTDTASGAIALRLPGVEEQGRGIVLCFEWYSSDGDALVLGDLSESPSGLIMTRAEVVMQKASGITRDLLRRLPIGDVLAFGRSHLRDHAPGAAPTTPPGTVETVSGRTKMDDDLLRRVARAYVEETGPDKGRGAMKRMSERFGRPEGTVQTWIKRARKEGWLAPGPPGRMGAEPGPRLVAWQLEEFKGEHPGLISHVQVRPDGSVRDISEPFSVLEPDDYESGDNPD